MEGGGWERNFKKPSKSQQRRNFLPYILGPWTKSFFFFSISEHRLNTFYRHSCLISILYSDTCKTLMWKRKRYRCYDALTAQK